MLRIDSTLCKSENRLSQHWFESGLFSSVSPEFERKADLRSEEVSLKGPLIRLVHWSVVSRRGLRVRAGNDWLGSLSITVFVLYVAVIPSVNEFSSLQGKKLCFQTFCLLYCTLNLHLNCTFIKICVLCRKFKLL